MPKIKNWDDADWDELDSGRSGKSNKNKKRNTAKVGRLCSQRNVIARG